MEPQVIIIGAGLSGLVAAQEAAEAGASVLVLDRGAAGIGTNSALANGMFARTTASYTAGDYAGDVLEIGRRINRPSYVRQVARRASGVVPFLQSHGFDLQESSNSCLLRASSPGVIPGVTLMKRLAEHVQRLEGIDVLAGFHATELLSDGGEVFGVRGFTRQGGERSFVAQSVILACGGAGAIYERNDNARTLLGQGYCLAAKAGLELRDMEFVQFYPIVLAEPGLPSMMIYPPYPEEARLVNADGENVVEKHGLGDINAAIRRQRDTFSALLAEEAKRGPVRMDLRQVPESGWKRHPLSLLARLKFDARRLPVRIGPAAHFCIGGVEIDDQGKTALEGLFACGEMVWGLHGANRMGGNALAECVVSGMMAGGGAARHALSVRPRAPVAGRLPTGVPVGEKEDNEDFGALRKRLARTAWTFAGIVRDGGGLKAAVAAVEDIERRLRKAAVRDVRDRIRKDDLTAAAFAAGAVLAASLGRKESRGTFIRSDFPRQDDARWLRNSRLHYHPADGSFRVCYEPVNLPGKGG